MRSQAVLRRLAACAVITVAACNDSNAPPTISNPDEIVLDLFAVDGAFNSDAYRALQEFSGLIPIPAAPAIAPVVAALRGTLPPAPSRAALALLGRDLPRRNAPRLANILGPASRPPVLPDTLLGITFEWEPDSVGYVASSRSGAPLTGVRFILYRTDAVTSLPDTGLEVGSLDVIDVAPAAGNQLRFQVRGVADTPTFLDYTLTHLPGVNAFTVQASGFVSNGALAAGERRFTFDASITHNDLPQGTSESVDFTYDVNVPDVAVELHLAASDDTLQDSSLTAIDYRFTHRNETLRLLGADTATAGGSTDEGRYAVSVNTRLYATLTFAAGNAVITDANGSVVPVNENDQRYEDDIMVIMVLSTFFQAGILADVLTIPAILLSLTFGLL